MAAGTSDSAALELGNGPAVDGPEGLHVFADGSFMPSSGAGGWGFVVYRDGAEIARAAGGKAEASSNGMELTALLMAARWLAERAPDEAATIWTDSHYAAEGCSRWRHIWKSRGWRKKGPDPRARSRDVPFRDLWIALDTVLTGNPHVAVRWCKGHSGMMGNETSDHLASLGRSGTSSPDET
jgi:ribonuclease HI